MLLFDVIGQSLKRTDHFDPATDSVEYLKAKFTFNDSAWSGKTKTALFRIGTDTFKAVIGTDGTCKVPSTALASGIATNNSAVTIECEYIRDTNKVIEKLTNAIIALGGSV